MSISSPLYAEYQALNPEQQQLVRHAFVTTFQFDLSHLHRRRNPLETKAPDFHPATVALARTLAWDHFSEHGDMDNEQDRQVMEDVLLISEQRNCQTIADVLFLRVKKSVGDIESLQVRMNVDPELDQTSGDALLESDKDAFLELMEKIQQLFPAIYTRIKNLLPILRQEERKDAEKFFFAYRQSIAFV